jgi:predicted nuclease of predicted toxin-antitoxin system
VAIAAIINSAIREKMTLDENVVKHIVFSSFRNIHHKLGKTYGRHLLLCDSRSWRKDAFEHYKANRSYDSKEDSKIDWNMIFRLMSEIEEAFDKHFPFHVIRKKGCEADDLIAAFAKNPKEPVCIVSKDKDFFQLIKKNVTIYNPMKKKFIEIEDPKGYRIGHILAGDVGDGVPNVLSDDDTFVTKKRQKPMTAPKIKMLTEYALTDFVKAPADLKRNWDRNKMLIDLIEPKDFAMEEVDKFYSEPFKEITQVETANYLSSQKMIVLMGKISDFYVGYKEEKKEGGLSSFL